MNGVRDEVRVRVRVWVTVRVRVRVRVRLRVKVRVTVRGRVRVRFRVSVKGHQGLGVEFRVTGVGYSPCEGAWGCTFRGVHVRPRAYGPVGGRV